MSARTILIVSGIVGALGIVIGAFGAHSLPKLLKDLQPEEFAQRQAWLETGVKYHMYHAAALLAIGLAGQRSEMNFSASGIAWLIGILVFSGCLYAMTMTGIKVLGAIVPIGGVAFIVGWVMVIINGIRHGS